MLAVLVPAKITSTDSTVTHMEIRLEAVDDADSLDLSFDGVELGWSEHVVVDLRALQRALQVIEQEQSIAHGAAIRTTAAEHF